MLCWSDVHYWEVDDGSQARTWSAVMAWSNARAIEAFVE
jgi:hypothetical protein